MSYLHPGCTPTLNSNWITMLCDNRMEVREFQPYISEAATNTSRHSSVWMLRTSPPWPQPELICKNIESNCGHRFCLECRNSWLNAANPGTLWCRREGYGRLMNLLTTEVVDAAKPVPSRRAGSRTNEAPRPVQHLLRRSPTTGGSVQLLQKLTRVLRLRINYQDPRIQLSKLRLYRHFG